VERANLPMLFYHLEMDPVSSIWCTNRVHTNRGSAVAMRKGTNHALTSPDAKDGQMVYPKPIVFRNRCRTATLGLQDDRLIKKNFTISYRKTD
jgi:hypothetical protein